MQENVLDTIDKVRLGQTLMKARQRVRFMRQEAATKASIDVVRLAHFETGREQITPHELLTLARVYKASVHDILRHAMGTEIEPFTTENTFVCLRGGKG